MELAYIDCIKIRSVLYFTNAHVPLLSIGKVIHEDYMATIASRMLFWQFIKAQVRMVNKAQGRYEDMHERCDQKKLHVKQSEHNWNAEK